MHILRSVLIKQTAGLQGPYVETQKKQQTIKDPRRFETVSRYSYSVVPTSCGFTGISTRLRTILSANIPLLRKYSFSSSAASDLENKRIIRNSRCENCVIFN